MRPNQNHKKNQIPFVNRRVCMNYIDGKLVESGSKENLDVFSPIDGTIISQLKAGNSDDVNTSVESSKKAFEKWSQTSVKSRAEILFNVRELMKTKMDELAEICILENGKTIDESKAGIAKGIELIEYAASLPHIIGSANLEVS